MKIYLCAFTAMVSIAALPQTLLAERVEVLTRYVKEALENSAELQSAYEAYRAAHERIPQVTSLPDPKLSYGYFLESVETRVGPQEHRLGVSQSFPWFGTLSLRGDVSTALARAQLARFESIKDAVLYSVQSRYAQLALNAASAEITKENIQLLQSWEGVLRERFRSGSGSHTDLIRVQVELGRLEERLLQLEDQQRPLQVAFNAVLNLPAHTDVIVSADYLERATEEPIAPVSFETIVERNPELAMLAAAQDAGESGVALAKKEYLPDFTVGLDYIVTGDGGREDGGDDAVMGTLSFDLPIYFRKNRASVAEARAKERSAQHAHAAKSFQLRSQLAEAEFQLRDSQRKRRLYAETLIPKAEESIEASNTAYQSGESGFLEVITAEQRLLEFQLSLANARADTVIAVAKLKQLASTFSHRKETVQETKEVSDE